MSSVLILGGSGFIGSHVVEQLAPAAKKIMTINRGATWNTLWDTAAVVQPLITQNFQCDRDKSKLIDCEELVNYDFSAADVATIVDLSTFRAEQMIDSLEFVQKKFADCRQKPLYVYISTDSVYEVCKRDSDEHMFNHRGLLSEADSVRPDSEDERKKLTELDSYADNKLAAEEVLIANHDRIPFLILRIPDVIGPRDQSDGARWWRYQIWARLASNCINGEQAGMALHIPRRLLQRPLSFVYAVDVARLIGHVFESYCKAAKTGLVDLPFINNIYNFAWPKPVTLPKLLDNMFEALQTAHDASSYEVPGNARPLSFYPSVTRSAIDASKFMIQFADFKFTPLAKAIKATVDFFERVSYQQSLRPQFIDVLRKLLADFKDKGIVTKENAYWQCVSQVYRIPLDELIG